MLDRSAVHKGRDNNGHYSVQFSLDRDDPLVPFVLECARRGSIARMDRETGFRTEGGGDKRYAKELCTSLVAMLPPNLREEVFEEIRRLEAAKSGARKTAAQSTMDTVIGGLRAVTGLRDGAMFDIMRDMAADV